MRDGKQVITLFVHIHQVSMVQATLIPATSSIQAVPEHHHIFTCGEYNRSASQMKCSS